MDKIEELSVRLSLLERRQMGWRKVLKEIRYSAPLFTNSWRGPKEIIFLVRKQDGFDKIKARKAVEDYRAIENTIINQMRPLHS